MSSVFEEIKERVDLVELINLSLPLKRSGSTYKALCPFHADRTPSFHVFPSSRRYRCFGCSATGDCFDWLVEHDNMGAADALRYLAQRVGVSLDEDGTREHRRRLYDVLAEARAFYEDQLHSSRDALAYLKRRGISDATISDFGIGWASGGRGLWSHLIKRYFSDDEVADAGLSIRHQGMLTVDFFKNRLVFPIRDRQGSTIAFGGRVLSDKVQPKYLNSRDTLVFHKSHALYGLELAQDAIKKARQAIVVEGYMDVLQAHQHGYSNVVATLGTAVTDKHLKQLAGIADEIVLALDPDSAGQRATWRSVHLASQALRGGPVPVVRPGHARFGLAAGQTARVRVVALDRDPDETIRSDPARWPALVGEAVPAVEFVLSRIMLKHRTLTPEEVADAAREMAPVLSAITNPVEQAEYVDSAVALLDVDPAAMRKMLQASQPERARLEDSPAMEVGRELDVYGCALLRFMDLPDADDLDVPFATAEGRSYASIGRRRADDNLQRFDEGVTEAAASIGAQLEVVREKSDWVWSEWRRTTETLRRLSLFQHRADLLELLCETDDAEERSVLAQKLSSVDDRIRAQDAQGARPDASASTSATIEPGATR